MAKAIRSYPKNEQRAVVARRLAGSKTVVGLGTLSAKGWEAWEKKQNVIVAPKVTSETLTK
jgi:hypothetical protein